MDLTVPLELGAQSVEPVGSNRPIPNARREPATPLPALEPGDSLRVLVVTIDTAARPKMETLQLGGTLSERSRARLAAWVLEGTYRLTPVEGKLVESIFLATPRALAGFRGSSGGAEPGMEVRRSRGPMMRPGDLSIDRMRAIAPRIARLASDLDTLFILKDSTVQFNSVLRIGALAANGEFLGTISFFDSGISDSRIAIDAFTLTGRALGVSKLRITFPVTVWEGQPRPAPSMEQVVVVTDDAVKAAAMRVAVGSGGGTCQFNRSGCYLLTSQLPGNVGGRDGPRQMRLLVLVKHAERLGSGTRPLERVRDTAQLRARERAELEVRRGFEDRDRFFVGTVDETGQPVGFSLSRMSDTVFIGTQHFTGSWRRDSSHVVLADYTDGPTPRVQAFMIPSAYPEGVDDKHWTSGDTTFTVRVRDAEDRWRRFLSRYPALAAFLR